eukprot:COSAG04_NODE_2160_length_4654_cov_1.775631_3_plen_725_part_00
MSDTERPNRWTAPTENDGWYERESMERSMRPTAESIAMLPPQERKEFLATMRRQAQDSLTPAQRADRAEDARIYGNEHFRAQRWAEAAFEYQSSIHLHSTSTAGSNLAAALLKMGEFEAAMEAAEAALELPVTTSVHAKLIRRRDLARKGLQGAVAPAPAAAPTPASTLVADADAAPTPAPAATAAPAEARKKKPKKKKARGGRKQMKQILDEVCTDDLFVPAVELAEKAEAALAAGDKLRAMRLSFAASQHAGTRGLFIDPYNPGQQKYRLTSQQEDRTMELHMQLVEELVASNQQSLWQAITDNVQRELGLDMDPSNPNKDKEKPQARDPVTGEPLSKEVTDARQADMLKSIPFLQKKDYSGPEGMSRWMESLRLAETSDGTEEQSGAPATGAPSEAEYSSLRYLRATESDREAPPDASIPNDEYLRNRFSQLKSLDDDAHRALEEHFSLVNGLADVMTGMHGVPFAKRWKRLVRRDSKTVLATALARASLVASRSATSIHKDDALKDMLPISTCRPDKRPSDGWQPWPELNNVVPELCPFFFSESLDKMLELFDEEAGGDLGGLSDGTAMRSLGKERLLHHCELQDHPYPEQETERPVCVLGRTFEYTAMVDGTSRLLLLSSFLDALVEIVQGEGSKCCAECGNREAKLLSCSRCGCANYCSRECQTTHFKKVHKKECKELARGARSNSPSRANWRRGTSRWLPMLGRGWRRDGAGKRRRR